MSYQERITAVTRTRGCVAFWDFVKGEGREASYADFPLLGRGPFGQAVRIRKEDDPSFRPFLFVPRPRASGMRAPT